MLEDYYGERKGVMKGGTARARGDMNLNMRHNGLARAEWSLFAVVPRPIFSSRGRGYLCGKAGLRSSSVVLFRTSFRASLNSLNGALYGLI